MKKQPTPRPWKVYGTYLVPTREPRVFRSEYSTQIWSRNGLVCTVSGRGGRLTKAKVAANARLIATSPDMFDTLEKIANGPVSMDKTVLLIQMLAIKEMAQEVLQEVKDD